jgi:hypothetical protein
MGGTLPVRFADKFGKLSAGAKRGNSRQTHGDRATIARAISARIRPKRLVFGRLVAWTLQTTQRRMVGE